MNCPFCDSPTYNIISYQGMRRVQCARCNTLGPVGANEAEAIRLWEERNGSVVRVNYPPGPSELKTLIDPAKD